jgi:hypothetical protein
VNIFWVELLLELVMKSKVLFLCTAIVMLSSLRANTIDEGDDIDQRDINALREWINTKRQVTVKELGGALSLAGEVRTEFQSTGETKKGKKQRGTGGETEVPQNTFDIEVNIMLDYRADGTWGSIKLEFDNDAGIIGGTLNKLKLERAYWGARVIDAETFTLDTELGRRRASSILDSKLEFNSFFDGAWFKYDQSFESIGDFYVHTGVFLINEKHNQFGYTGEIGLLNVAMTGFYTKYSLIDWDTKHLKEKIQNKRYHFIVSQLLFGYRFMPERLQRVVQIYAAGLYNHVARRLKITDHEKQNWGGYAGVSIGEIKKKGDWAFDINYQVLQAQCIPDFDVQGIGLGTADGSGFYTANLNGTGAKNTQENAGGNVNYRGFQMTLDYLLTNQLDMQQSWQQSITLDHSIGPFRRFKQYEVEFIYAF